MLIEERRSSDFLRKLKLAYLELRNKAFSVNDLAKATVLSVRQARRFLDELKEAKLIDEVGERKKGRVREKLYMFDLKKVQEEIKDIM